MEVKVKKLWMRRSNGPVYSEDVNDVAKQVKVAEISLDGKDIRVQVNTGTWLLFDADLDDDFIKSFVMSCSIISDSMFNNLEYNGKPVDRRSLVTLLKLHKESMKGTLA